MHCAKLLMLGVRLRPSGHEGAMTKSRPRRSRPPAVVHDLPATIDDRRARGRAARKRAGRRGLGHWEERDRGHDALSTILAQNKIRVAELVPIRHYRMAVSAWNYYRGAAAVMAGDLASQPDSGLIVQLCGDAHVLTWPVGHARAEPVVRPARLRRNAGPFEWDVKRFAASLAGAARENGSAEGRQRGGGRRGGGLLQADPPVPDDARARHLVRQHARRQPDRLFQAGRPRSGRHPHREEAQTPDQPGRVRQAHHDGARAAADNRGTPDPRQRSATTSRTT